MQRSPAPTASPGTAIRTPGASPAEVLKFMELRPGQHALDYFAAAGYYTELMSRVVGADGKVIAYNNRGVPEIRRRCAGEALWQQPAAERH